ncbi:sigma-70 family RNA polymerase sigma factor [Vibrio coralliilyticus OCN008]|uniref:sigma-70 family RNA polymerase sigma factor n=1 Tax=Vibrio coralliilyticus TaxID=190893 RepID=UPI00039120A6|nr:sigma-70 family RNA polymerase sigma factor [Vibrio coralliilyticus]ERB62410.1 hypothetical protein N779_26525 [Vibrio coralliilyticus OCN008]QIJ84728.1 sigma-70 family RNA polymerase sigma factor [Vibrio coralliilyticus OCN008]
MEDIKEEMCFELIYSWCYMMASKFFRLYGGVSGIEFDDFLNSAYVAACRSFNNFDPCKGKLENYMLKCINLELGRIVSDSYKYQSQTDSIDELLLNGIDVNSFLKSDTEIDNQSLVIFENNLEGVLFKLDERKLNIIFEFYFKGRTFKDIANDLEISPSRVSQLHTEIILDLRYNWK